MSRPRKPYGPNPPGRLLGTMIKVLAAEMSDQGRLSRGKRYWADDAVVDIVVGHGSVTAEVQGARPEPYVVTVEADRGSGVPSKREVWAQCTCPDDTGTGADLCKHAVAAMFALADEVSIDPELVDRWRAGRGRVRPDEAVVTELRPMGDDGDSGDDEVDGDDVDDDAGSDDDDHDADVIEFRPRVDPEVDAIARLLASPGPPPTFPEVTELDHGPLRDRRLGDVLDDCLDHLAIRWE